MKTSHSSAFTLIELIAVLAIISVIVVAGFPTLQGIIRSQSTSAQLSHLRGFMQDARMSARAKGTWVRVGFHERTGPGGERDIVATAILSTSGGSPGETDVTDAAEWPILGRPLILRGATLEFATDGADTLPSFQRVVSGRPIEFDRVIEVSPSGVIRAREGNLDRVIEFTISPDVGNSPSARLQVAGASGMMRILR